MKISKFILLILLALSIPLSACAPVNTNEGAENILIVTASILPQKYFLERIGRDHVQVNVMVGTGANPATYEPKPDQLVALSESVAYFSIGVPFEKAWLDKIKAANTEMLIVDTTAGIVRVPINAHYKFELGGKPESNTEGRDPHIWLSPTLVKNQAKTIYNTLVELDPSNETDYKTNLNGFIADINQLEMYIKETLKGIKSRKFMTFHPAWGYFGDDFELEMIPIEIGGTEPSARELAQFIDAAKKDNIRIIFAQPEFSTKSANYIASEIGGRVILISPLAEDWLENLRLVSQTLAPSLTH